MKYYKNFFTSLCNNVMPTQAFNYSVILDQLIPCIDEAVEEGDTAPLFKIEYLNKMYMSRMEQLGIVRKSIQPDSKERIHVDALLYSSTRNEETSSLYTGSDRANLKHANMICDASDASK